MRGVLHGAGSKEQEALEDRVVEHMQQPGGKANDRERRYVSREPKHAGTDAEQDNPDILDAVIGKQPLQIVLRQREQHAENAA